ncbi:metallophosphatase family protein [candidate division NPL-UPA2 bacterium]|nr:metallophosphatase family protein [candidate division NPL-UPA2 bacterium]
MRYGLFSDIHGNLEALQAVLDALRKEDIDNYICLGDIVGYGANPRECLELIEDLNPVAIAGNHDYAAVKLTNINYFNSDAKEAILWTQNQLKEKEKKFLNALRLVHNFPDFTIVHATLKAPEEWRYILSTYEAKESFQLLTVPLLFTGHSHVPIVFEGNARYRYDFRKTVNLEEGRKYIINIGSVGQPRDGDPRASFALYDTESRLVEVKRVEYNIPETMKKIIEAGLPRMLAWRLSQGT